MNINASKTKREALNIENKKIIMKMKKIRNVMATEFYLSEFIGRLLRWPSGRGACSTNL